jgi:serine kinase of HPr protein (carbohydrate metabolism regulator)
VQVLGEACLAYLRKLEPAARARLPRKLARKGMTHLIVAAGAPLLDARRWAAAGIDVAYRTEPAHELVYRARRELAAEGRHAVLHGTFLQVHGAGVLLEGAAGAGKSALALELLARGHALVADDAVEFCRPAPAILVGRSPAVIEGYLETRGLGVLDVRRMHGARAVRALARLDLIVRLQRGRARALSAAERLRGRRGTRRVLGEAVPVLSLQTRHNLAALVEAACLDRRLQLDGVDAPAALERRQARAIRRKQ